MSELPGDRAVAVLFWVGCGLVKTATEGTLLGGKTGDARPEG